MKQSLYGLLLLVVLAIPPVARYLESIMIVHMHMQMPLLVIAGFLIGRFFQLRLGAFFDQWNGNGVPGILLFVLIMLFWMLPRSMDEALTLAHMEVWKFISLPFLAGVPLRNSWGKLTKNGKNMLLGLFAALFVAMGWLFIMAPESLCNNYLVLDQVILGWGYITMAICLIVLLGYRFFIDPSEYE